MRIMRTPAPAALHYFPSMVTVVAAVLWIIQAYRCLLVNAMTEEHRMQEYKKRYYDLSFRT